MPGRDSTAYLVGLLKKLPSGVIYLSRLSIASQPAGSMTSMGLDKEWWVDIAQASGDSYGDAQDNMERHLGNPGSVLHAMYYEFWKKHRFFMDEDLKPMDELVIRMSDDG